MSLGARRSAPGSELLVARRHQAAGGRAGSGGDWFDAFTAHDGSIALVVGDVAGHDTLAVTLMMQLRTLSRTIAHRPDIPAREVLRRLDHAFIRLGSDRTATAIFAWVSSDNAGRPMLRWCNAGHPAPVLVTADYAVILDSTDDPLLGLDAHSRRSDLTHALPAGATLLLYSDGLIETRTQNVDHGLRRLCAAAQLLATLPVTQFRDSLLPVMVAADAADDVTLAAIRVSGSELRSLGTGGAPTADVVPGYDVGR